MNKVFDYKKYILPGDIIKICDIISNYVIEKAKTEKIQFSIIEISEIHDLSSNNNG
jgi:hypothetical protein